MKKTLLFLSIVICTIVGLHPFGANAQTPNWSWAKSAGGTSNDLGQSVSTDASGNAFVTGYFQSPTIPFGSTTTLTNAGSSNIFLAKYDASGNVLWAKSAGGTSFDEGLGISTDRKSR